MSRILSLIAVFSSLPALAWAAASLEARYPYDPACPWGRLANGKGMLHRCLTEREAISLAQGDPPPVNPTCDPGQANCAEKNPRENSPEKEPSSARDFELVVGPISADQGEITIGRLGVPTDRYRQCVSEAGGLKGTRAQVVVKFLVRGERLRAEGASVESFEGVSEEAAKCLAFVVDRRKVGAPSVPMTGAHLTFRLTEKK